MLKHILLPIDGLEGTDVAIRAGVEIAKEAHARLTGYFATPTREFEHIPRFGFPFLPEVPPEDALVEQVSRVGRDALRAVKDAARAAGVRCDTQYEATPKPIDEAIVGAAHAHHADLIFLRRRAARGAFGFMRWNRAEIWSVLSHSDVPVLVCPDSHAPRQQNAPPITHILVPTDGSELARKAIDAAVAFAAQVGARVTGVYAFDPSDAALTLDLGGALAGRRPEFVAQQRQVAREYLRVLEAQAEREHVPCSINVEEDHFPPGNAIVRAADRLGCDAIFMATHGRHGWDALLHPSQTEQVVAHCNVPVIVLH